MHPLALTFRFEHVPPEGRAFAGEIETALVAESVTNLIGELGYRALGPLTVTGTAWPARRDLVIHARFQGSVGFDCVRCLAARELRVDQAVQHVLVHKIEGPLPGEDEIEISDDDAGADEHAFDGDTVALTDIFREDLLLELPMNPSCEEAGLPACAPVGIGVEEVVREDSVDPRWAPLAALRAKLGDKSS